MNPMETAPQDRPVLLWQEDVEEAWMSEQTTTGRWLTGKRVRQVTGGQWVVGEWCDWGSWNVSYPCLADEPEIDNPVGWVELPPKPARA